MQYIKQYGVVTLVVVVLVGAAVYLLVGRSEPKADLELPEGGTVEVTPLDEMRVRTAESDPVIDTKTYTLTVTGLVESPLTFTFDEMISFLREKKIASYKLPERLEIVDEFPMARGEKVAKRELIEDITGKLKAEGKMPAI